MVRGMPVRPPPLSFDAAPARETWVLVAVRWLGLWLVVSAGLLVALHSVLHDSHYWDAGGCYVHEARLHLQNGIDLNKIRQQLPWYLLRPPFYTGLLSLFMRIFGTSPIFTHIFHILFCALLPVASAGIVKSMGGDRRAQILAVLLCVSTSIYIAQITIVQTDLPAATLVSLAWWSLLQRRTAFFCLFSSLAVWTKESGYFIAVPAAVYLWWQATLATPVAGPDRQARLRRAWTLLWAAWPTLVAPLALVLWMAVRRFIKGNWMESDHVHALSLISPAAHYHNWLDAGRFALSIFVCLGLYLYWKDRSRTNRPEVLCTGLALFLLPWLFPSYLPRYMVLSIAFSTSLAALAISSLTSFWQARALLLVLMVQIGAQAGYFTIRDIAHLESSLAYRGLLRLHQQAAALVAAQGPRQVLTGFPATFFLSFPPDLRYIRQAVPTWGARPDDTLTIWCQSDWLLEAQDDTVQPAIRALHAIGALTLVAQLGPPPIDPRALTLDKERDQTIRLYRIHCPPGAR